MPKKRQGFKSTKPSPTVHPSLSRSVGPASPRKDGEVSAPSVNELLSHLRKSQAPSSRLSSFDTTQPSLESSIPLDGHERQPAMQNDNRPLRRPPGPAPPPSWSTSTLTSNAVESRNQLKTTEQKFDEQWQIIRTRPTRLGRCPGFDAPVKDSLQHLALKQLAQMWDLHAIYNQHHLGYLPIQLKYQLLEYIAVHGPERGLTIGDLRMLFPTLDEDPDLACNEDVTCLDLSRSIGRSITVKQLKSYLKMSRHQSGDPDPLMEPAADEEDGDSWEACDDAWVHSSISSSPFRFCNLTHLMLSHPPSTISWSDLLSLGPSLATITHLSLAYWPIPCLTPNTVTDESRAANLLRRFSKATYCLKWLDLEGCYRWLRALYWNDYGEGIEWTGAWRGLQTLIIGMSDGLVTRELMLRDRDLQPARLLDANRQPRDFGHMRKSTWISLLTLERHVKTTISERRSAAACPWLDVVTSTVDDEAKED